MKVLLQTLAYVEIFKSKSEDFIMYWGTNLPLSISLYEQISKLTKHR